MGQEIHVERHLVKRVTALGGFTKKIVSAGDNFWPDRLVVLPYYPIVLVELKKPTGRLSEGQKELHKRFSAVGHEVITLWSKEEVDDWMESIGA